MKYTATERALKFMKAQGIREAAELMLGKYVLFDDAEDNALISVQLRAIADDYDEEARS